MVAKKIKVEDADLVTAGEKFWNKNSPDVSGSACDENLFNGAHWRIFASCLAAMAQSVK